MLPLESQPFLIVQQRYLQEKEVFDSYVNLLIKEGLAFYTETPECFPRLNLKFDMAGIITSATVVYSGSYDFDKLVDQLSECNCKSLRLFITKRLESIQEVEELLGNCFSSTLRSIDIFFDFFSSFREECVKELSEKYKKIGNIFVCSCDGDKAVGQNRYVFLTTPVKHLMSKKLENLLVVNIEYFAESQQFNPVYNKKVFITEKGDVKNGAFTKKTFGNIKTARLPKIVSSSSYQKLWKTIPWSLRNSELRYCLYNAGKAFDLKDIKNCKVAKQHEF